MFYTEYVRDESKQLNRAKKETKKRLNSTLAFGIVTHDTEMIPMSGILFSWLKNKINLLMELFSKAVEESI